jgi:hypothetical protein
MLLLQPVAAGLFAPRVRCLLLAPEAPPPPPPAPRELGRGLRAMIGATLAVMTGYWILAAVGTEPFYRLARRAGLFADGAVDFSPTEMVLQALLEVPGVILISMFLGRYLVYPSVVTMERLGGLRALRRAAALTVPFRRTAAMVLGLHFGARYGAVWVFWLALAQLARVPYLAVIDVARDSVAADVGLLLILPLQMVFWTITFSAMSIVYLDARRAEGVTLEAVPEPAEAEAISPAA